MRREFIAFGIALATSGVLVASAGAAVIARGTLGPLNNEPAAGNVVAVKLADGRRVLRFTGGPIGPGPALRVYLVAGTVNGNADINTFKDLGPLKATTGAQSYAVPRGVDLKRFRTVVIWCADFSVAFGKAVLKPS